MLAKVQTHIPPTHQAYAQPSNQYMFHANSCTHRIINHVSTFKTYVQNKTQLNIILMAYTRLKP